MSNLHAIIYGAIQGLTEFLPVSSSVHLVLLPIFTGWEDPGLGFVTDRRQSTWTTTYRWGPGFGEQCEDRLR